MPNVTALVTRSKDHRILARDDLCSLAMRFSDAERSVLQSVMPNGNCLKAGQGRRGNHWEFSGATASQETERFGLRNLGCGHRL